MRRREFIVGSAMAALPLPATAQQAIPLIGFLGGATATGWSPYVNAFLEGLGEAGYIADRNVAIEYRWAEGQYDRLPAMAADLVHRRVTMIAASGTPASLAAKAVAATIPIVFTTIGDPVQLGLVTSLNRPGGNVTGVTQLNVDIGPKLLELMHEVVPAATTIGLLVNPANSSAERLSKDLQTAARTLGLQLHIVKASTEADIDAAFETLVLLRAGELVLGGDAFINTQSGQIAQRALRHRLPAIYQARVFAAAGGLMSYGGSGTDAYRQAGVYSGRVLKGEKPADLPVVQATKVEMTINLKTAKALGVTVPLNLLGRADEVIE